MTSDELIEDAAATQGYINGRLSFFIIVRGRTSIAQRASTIELVGITGRSGVNAYARGTVDTNVEAIAKVISNTRGLKFH